MRAGGESDGEQAAASARSPRRRRCPVTRLSPPHAGFFSKRCLSACGVPVLAHACVADDALREAARRVDALLLHLPACAARLRALGTSVQIIGAAQRCSDLPQYACKRANPDEAAAFDARGRGYGGLCPSCGEENLLRLPCDRYRDHRDICTHELAHTVLDWGFPPAASRELKARLDAVRLASMEQGRWRGAYAATNADEFFAECAMWMQGSRGDYGQIDTPPPAEGAAWLRAHDPDAAALMHDVLRGAYPAADAAAGEETAKQLAPVAENARSTRGDGAACLLLVVNDTSEAASVHWINADGVPVPYGCVPAGAVHGQATYVGHVWRLTAPGGRVLGTYVARAGLGRVHLRPPGARGAAAAETQALAGKRRRAR